MSKNKIVQMSSKKNFTRKNNSNEQKKIFQMSKKNFTRKNNSNEQKIVQMSKR